MHIGCQGLRAFSSIDQQPVHAGDNVLVFAAHTGAFVRYVTLEIRRRQRHMRRACHALANGRMSRSSWCALVREKAQSARDEPLATRVNLLSRDPATLPWERH
jgi:hypothetical protein